MYRSVFAGDSIQFEALCVSVTIVPDCGTRQPGPFAAPGTTYLVFKDIGNPAYTVAAEVKGKLQRKADGTLHAKVTDLIPLLPA